MGKEIFELTAPCHFGMEAVLKREINDLGYEISKVENGKVELENVKTGEKEIITIGELINKLKK